MAEIKCRLLLYICHIFHQKYSSDFHSNIALFCILLSTAQSEDRIGQNTTEFVFIEAFFLTFLKCDTVWFRPSEAKLSLIELSSIVLFFYFILLKILFKKK